MVSNKFILLREPTKQVFYAACHSRYVFDGDEGRLTEAAFLRDFAGDLPGAARGCSTRSLNSRFIRRSGHWVKAFHVPLLTPNGSRAFHFAVAKIAAQHQGMW